MGFLHFFYTIRQKIIYEYFVNFFLNRYQKIKNDRNVTDFKIFYLMRPCFQPQHMFLIGRNTNFSMEKF